MSHGISPGPTPASSPAPQTWWREVQFWGLLILAGAGYFWGLDRLPLRGEESRRARIAIEMLERGDFVVPRQQGEPFLSRPPLQNWLIAALGLTRDAVDVWAIRLPSALAMLLVTAVVYGYGRTFLSPPGALVAGLAWATAGQALELGRLGETEAVFTATVATSLLGWHWGWTRGWPRWLTWNVAGLAVAAGVLAKGPQAPVYFVSVVMVYLLCTREWRELFRPAPWGAAVVALGVVGLWLVPFWSSQGTQAVWRIFADDVGLRFSDTRWSTIVAHLASYPWEIVACLLPWSIPLAVFLRPAWRRLLIPWPRPVVFLVIALAVTFPSCWLVPGARGRYYMPLYPCLALLTGLVADQAAAGLVPAITARPWRRFLRGTAVVATLAASAIWVLSLVAPQHPAAQAAPGASLFLLAGWAAAGVLWWAAPQLTPRRIEWSAAALAGLLLATHLGIIQTAQLRRAEDTRAAVAALETDLGQHPRLVSFGPAHHLFAYHLGRPITLLPWPESSAAVPADVEYFCYETMPGVPVRELPFVWQPVRVISCERNRQENPGMTVVVGRRLRTEHTARSTSPGSEPGAEPVRQ